MKIHNIKIHWQNSYCKGKIENYNCDIIKMEYLAETKQWRKVESKKELVVNGNFTLKCTIAEKNLLPPRISVPIENNFITSFFVRDANEANPIFLKDSKLIVTEGSDKRSFAQITREISTKKMLSSWDKIAKEKEESFEEAARNTRSVKCPTWLGISRDIRIFSIHYFENHGYWGQIIPKYHCGYQCYEEDDEEKRVSFDFAIGRGASCTVNITRWLEENNLPILHSLQNEGDIKYHLTFFVTLEKTPLNPRRIIGTDYRSAYAYSSGNMLTERERKKYIDAFNKELLKMDEETLCIMRCESVNTSHSPHYAWFAVPSCGLKDTEYLTEYGFLQKKDDKKILYLARLNGQAMGSPQKAVLIQPEQNCVFEVIIPHRAIPIKRARKLLTKNTTQELKAVKSFWKTKLKTAAQIKVPETEIQNRMQAGILHCDLVAYGKEPDQPVAATIGWYSPIGSESAPIIQFFDSAGWHRLAERAIDFFLKRQRNDGFIQNFAGYQLETGYVLWTMSEHYRYTQDLKWLKRVKKNIQLASQYLIQWRRKNMLPELKNKGYGLIDGKVADPNDFFHSFMLNGISLLGLKRAAEMMEHLDKNQAKVIENESNNWHTDLYNAYKESIKKAPLIPIGDGTWLPSFSPWVEYPGPLSLYAEGGNWITHGAFGCRDALLGALYLIFCNVLPYDSKPADWLIKVYHTLYTVRNAALSQPYYSRHDYAHLVREEVKFFLKTYYNQVSSLQDRETYSFWEHYFGVSPHKTHEEAWFLMQTRWMLWLEIGETLRLLAGIPRLWLNKNNAIELKNVASHFGHFNFSLHSDPATGRKIQINIEFKENRLPAKLEIRVPHPTGKYAQKTDGCSYDREREIVTINKPSKKNIVNIFF
jgi:hypothetical protein